MTNNGESSRLKFDTMLWGLMRRAFTLFFILRHSCLCLSLSLSLSFSIYLSLYFQSISQSCCMSQHSKWLLGYRGEGSPLTLSISDPSKSPSSAEFQGKDIVLTTDIPVSSHSPTRENIYQFGAADLV